MNNRLQLKKYLAFTLLFSFISAGAVSAKTEKKAQIKSKAAQAKVFRKHEKNWHQPSYGRHIELFKCRDSWGHKLRGKFTSEQQYFIELGGGTCRRAGRHDDYGVLSQFYNFDFALDNVYYAIEQIKNRYGIRHARLIEADNISRGHRNLKYTLVFKIRGQGYREFRVKQNRWNGNVRAIYEV
ncbi:MAG: hypothetical protein OQJ89_15895 [Kangiellaceae bacterium]|nr:hypothetical protein [Kangiellaceae bacterium]MCW8998320.1 hypothetical protein [Kangiellaceae bacterium]MCW9018456.1 hypothetical protein [Kangiellaceae bacterium]